MGNIIPFCYLVLQDEAYFNLSAFVNENMMHFVKESATVRTDKNKLCAWTNKTRIVKENSRYRFETSRSHQERSLSSHTNLSLHHLSIATKKMDCKTQLIWFNPNAGTRDLHCPKYLQIYVMATPWLAASRLLQSNPRNGFTWQGNIIELS